MAFVTIAAPKSPADIPLVGVSIKRARGNDKAYLVTDDQNIALAKNVGAKLLRIDVYWADCETQRGVYDFSSVKPLIDKAWKAGMQVLPILARGNRLYTGDWDKPAVTPEARAAYAAFAVAAGRALGVPFLEIMNEPNNSEMLGGPVDPEAYGRLLNEVLLAMQAAGVKTPVIAGGLGVGGEGGFMAPKDFIARALPFVTAPGLRAWGVHPYTGADCYLSDPMMRPEAVQQRSLSFRPAGVQTMVFNTEQGFSVKHCAGSTLEQKRARQAVFATRFVLSALTQWQMAIWYNLIDDGKDMNNVEQGFGLYDFDMKIKPAGLAFQAAMGLLNTCASVIVRKDGDLLQGLFKMPSGDTITLEAAPL
ncbi:hypothetical protein ACLE20_13415 [Rhizobium sp. YIM 134829]|uniref:hypothetical protein n=1 Tax=Rhizobium sp. YIM 134829 TaxID=3390453 RepID=UPI00397A116B